MAYYVIRRLVSLSASYYLEINLRRKQISSQTIRARESTLKATMPKIVNKVLFSGLGGVPMMMQLVLLQRRQLGVTAEHG